jgi:flagellar hook assembly protein FlgD
VPIIDGFALRYTTYEPGQTGIDEYTVPELVNSKPSLQVEPNPFSHTTKIRCSILDTRSSIQNPQIGIYDASGRLVRSFDPESSIQNQESVFVWDGHDEFGRQMPNGIYFACLENKDNTVTAKIILVD